MKTANFKGVAVDLKNSEHEGCLVIFHNQLIQIICPCEIDIQEEPDLLACIDEYVMENKEKYEDFKLYQFSSYANATIQVKVEKVEREEEADTIYNIFKGKRKGSIKNEKKITLKEINESIDNFLNNNSKELPEYKGRKFIFRRELVINDEAVKTSPLGDRLIQNPIFKEFDGQEIEEVKEVSFMGDKKILGYIKGVPFEIRWCEEIK